MAIFASKNSLYNIPLIISEPKEGDTLIYDEKNGIFVNKKISFQNYNFVSSAKSLPGVNSKSVFKEKDNEGNLIFKSLQPGPGISLQENNDSIIITCVNSSDVFISEKDFSIIIDGDGNDTDAHFYLKTVVPTSSIVIHVNVLPPVTITDLYTGNTISRGYIESSSLNFFSYGFRKDMMISLEGSPDQDGIYLIDEVVLSGNVSKIYFTSRFEGITSLNLGGPKYPTTIKQVSLWIPDNDGSLGPGYNNNLLYSVQIWGVNIGVSGYNLEEDMLITITGTENAIIDGTYRIKRVFVSGNNPILKWPSIVFHETTPLPFNLTPGAVFDNNLLNNEIMLKVETHVKFTGFQVNKKGEVRADSVIVSSPTILPNQLTRKDYVDNQIFIKINEFYDVVVSGINHYIGVIDNEVEKLRKTNKKTLRYYLMHAKF
ncbi:MAG: hypothetical protein QXF12_01460 [Candidatus Aenigmatarchaeota archaeon]